MLKQFLCHHTIMVLSLQNMEELYIKMASHIFTSVFSKSQCCDKALVLFSYKPIRSVADLQRVMQAENFFFN